jgi:hypothetical protein
MVMPMPQSKPITAPTAVAPSSSNALTAGAVASANAPASVTSSTKIGSLADLKKKAPEVYNEMMKGIAMSVCQDMEAHQQRQKKIMRESENH